MFASLIGKVRCHSLTGKMIRLSQWCQFSIRVYHLVDKEIKEKKLVELRWLLPSGVRTLERDVLNTKPLRLVLVIFVPLFSRPVDMGRRERRLPQGHYCTPSVTPEPYPHIGCFVIPCCVPCVCVCQNFLPSLGSMWTCLLFPRASSVPGWVYMCWV